jgi:two-component sensor histidine kinase
MGNINTLSRLLFILIGLSCAFIMKSQAQTNLDSLILELEEELVDSNKAKLHLQIAEGYFNVSNDTGLLHTQKCLELALNSNGKIEALVFGKIEMLSYKLSDMENYQLGLACFEQLITYSNKRINDSLLFVSSYGKAAILLTQGEALKALEVMEGVLKLTENGLINERQEMRVYYLMAGIYVSINDLELSIRYTMDALKLAEKNKYQETEIGCYRHLADIYNQQRKYDKSLEYTQKALEIVEETGDSVELSRYHSILATICYNKASEPMNKNRAEDMVSFKRYTKKSLEIALKIDHKRLQGAGYRQLGNYYRDNAMSDTAIVFYTKALEFFILTGDRSNQVMVFSNLAESYWLQAKGERDEDRQKNYWTKAVFYGEKSFEISNELGRASDKRNIAEVLSEIYADLGKHYNAYKYLKIYTALADSSYREESVKILEDLEVKYKTEKKELAIKSLNQEKALQLIENKQQKTLLYAVGGILSVVLLLLGLLYWFFAQKRRANEELTSKNDLITQQKKLVDQQNEEKELLLKEIHHRVKNNLQIISSLLDLQSSKIDDDAARSAIADGQSRVKSMALIHHKLYQHENIATINIKEYIGQLFDQIMATLTATPPNLVLEIDEEVSFDIDTAIPLGLILNELLTNACKYAFEEGKEGELSICLEQKTAGDYSLKVKDNGNGMPADFNLAKARSLGLRLVRRLSKQLLGKATYKNDNGACFCIEFKNTALRKTID